MKTKKHSEKENDPVIDDGVDIKELISENSAFFDKLIDLIPAKFYLPVEDGKVWYPGLSKSEKAAVKKESKENTKKSRRDRMDPDKSSTTTLDLLKHSLETSKQLIESEEEEENEADNNAALEEQDSVAYEDLQKKLRLKIEELRSARGGGSERKTDKKNDKKKTLDNKKRKREPDGVSSSNGVETEVIKAANELKFSQVKMGDEPQKRGKKRKVSKLKELEKAKELALSKDEKVTWNNAMSRAAGVKVHDNPKLLERSLKKEKKRQQKNAKKWKERVDAQQKSKTEKQEARTKNIQEKIKQKKMKRIEKREKKLMRPGFEGRKKGYINEPHS